MKAFLNFVLITSLFSFISQAQEIPSDSMYLGFTPPGKTPEIFAPGIISLDNRNEVYITFSPDNKEVLYGTNEGIFFKEYKVSSWSNEKASSFSGFVNPNFSVNGNKMYLTKWSADYSTSDFWVSRRTAVGWSTPELLPEPYNSGIKVGNMTESTEGIIYFDSDNKIWQTLAVDSFPSEAQQLSSIINSSVSYSPCISSDGTYLIFNSERNDKIGNQDLYISFKDNKNIWTTPINMNSTGVNINKKNHSSINPSLSPDGKYLFYNFHNWTGLMPDIYWVSTEIIDDLKQIVLSTTVKKNELPNLKIFPNPADKEINIEGISDKNVKYKVIKIDASVVMQGILQSSKIDISDCNPGIYLLKLEFEDAIITRKIIIQ